MQVDTLPCFDKAVSQYGAADSKAPDAVKSI